MIIINRVFVQRRRQSRGNRVRPFGRRASHPVLVDRFGRRRGRRRRRRRRRSRRRRTRRRSYYLHGRI